MNNLSIAAVAVTAVLTSTMVNAQVRKSEVPGVRNFSRVDATIGCGGATQPEAMPALKNEGFRSVINLRLATEEGVDIGASRAAADSAGLKYIHLPFDTAKPDPELVDKFIAAVSDTANQPVYIHCGSANRVGAVWMIKRVLKDGWEVERAQTEAEAIGLTNPKLREFAIAYIQSHRR